MMRPIIAAFVAAAMLTPALATPPAALGKAGMFQAMAAKACVPGRPGCLPAPYRPPPNIYFYFWYGPYPPPYYYFNYYPPRPIVVPISCSRAKTVLRNHGFNSVKASDCEGRYYSFTALRGGHMYRINFNAYTGRYTWSIVRK